MSLVWMRKPHLKTWWSSCMQMGQSGDMDTRGRRGPGAEWNSQVGGPSASWTLLCTFTHVTLSTDHSAPGVPRRDSTSTQMVMTPRTDRQLSRLEEWFLVSPSQQEGLPPAFVKKAEIRHLSMVAYRDSGIITHSKANPLKKSYLMQVLRT